SYSSFIRHFAELAQEETCAMFCAGAELDKSADESWERDLWMAIIGYVKSKFLGPVTYAADWRTYRSIPFWDAVDVIGINAYFPPWVPGHHHPPDEPDVKNLSQEWKLNYIPEIEAFRDSLNLPDSVKPVIFTEIGYRSITGCATGPWDDTTLGSYDETEQRNCYIAGMHSFLGKPWFAGWFWHEWTTDHNQGGTGDLSYSPKDKPAQEVLRRWFAAIGTQRCITFTPRVWDKDCYRSGEAEQSLAKLAATGAEWVSILPQGWMDTVNTAAVVVRDTSNESPFSPTDSSLMKVIAWARESHNLRVVLKPHVDTRRGAFRFDHNPQGAVRQGWFNSYTDFIRRYARMAEQESCELFCVGCELDGTTDETADIERWQNQVIPAVRQEYSGPITYTRMGLGGTVLLNLWEDLDFVGVDAYFQLFPKELYPSYGDARDTWDEQTPKVSHVLTNDSLCGWEDKWLDSLKTLRQATDKPIIFPEIGYQPLDSSAWLGARPTHHNWIRQCSGTSLDLYSVCFPEYTITGFAVGDTGIILRTLDGGGSWDSLPVDGVRRVSLRCVQFPVNVRVGFAVGFATDSGGMVLRTTNRGDVWTRQMIHWPQGPAPFLWSVGFSEDSTVGFAVGNSGCLLKSTNVGADWYPQSSGTTADMRSIHFPCADTGFIVGDSGIVLRTTDAGSTWNRCSSGTGAALRAVCFSSSRIGYAVGDSGLYLRTFDGGDNWSRVRRSWTNATHIALAVPRNKAADSSVYVSDDIGNILRVDSVDTSWVIDGGRQAKPTRQRINSICFPDSLVGYAVGDSGVILKTREGGRNRIDFNEMRNCYEAAFRALWRSKEALNPIPWFYGFHWYDWWIQPEPKGVDHEVWLESMTMQQKPAQETLEVWFAARPADPGPFGHHVRHYPTGSLDVVVPQNGRVNVPLVLFRLESRSWEGGGPADQARL
ncbi:hypothetical protein FJY69_07175, partial [candidate division WOR-3 bacterium]|nr:hypothetical protein [candidate division WOR-3 bacterium]